MNGNIVFTIVLTLPILVRSQDETTLATTTSFDNETTTEIVTTEQVTTTITTTTTTTTTTSTTTTTTTTTTEETTTEPTTTIITTTIFDIPVSEDEIPLWAIILIVLSLLLLLLLGFVIYLKQFQPELWQSLKKNLPILSRQNQYQVSPLYSCKPHHGVLSRCFQNISCSGLMKCKWFHRTKQEPSRDTCFLCMRKVPEEDWEGHRLECAITNKDKLEHLSTPAPVRCFRCSTYLRVLPVYPVTVFLCDNTGKCPHQGRELVTNIHNRYNCYYCDFDLCADCIARMLTKSGGAGGSVKDSQISLDHEAELPRVRKVVRRIYSKSEIGIQTSTENVNKEMTETNFAS